MIIIDVDNVNKIEENEYNICYKIYKRLIDNFLL